MKIKKMPNETKMIWLKVGFWTNKLSRKKDGIVPKHARSFGYVYIGSNKLHGIKASQAHFDSPMQISSAIEKVLVGAGIKLYADQTLKKYILEERS